VLNNTQFSATQFMGLDVHPTDTNFTLGGTQDNGTNLRDSTGTWRRADFGDGGYAVIDQNATDTVNVRMYHTYFNSSNSLVGYATVATTAQAMDNGWTFRGCNNNIPNNGITCADSVLFYAPLERDPGIPLNTVYYGSDRLYRSDNNGVLNTVVSQAPIMAGVPISAIGISPQDDNVRIVGLRNGGLFGTTTGSTTLTNLDPIGTGSVIPDNYIGRAVVAPNSTTTAYVTVVAYNVNNVFKTTNLDAATPTWTPVVGRGFNTLPKVPVNSFLIDPQLPNNLYAGTDIGVFASSDGGVNWTPFGTGLPRLAVFGLEMAPGRIIRAATHGKGMYQISALEAGQVAEGFETDVAPRPSGDGQMQSNDVVQMIRFFNELDVPNMTSNEFQRADSAPRSSRGDGVINSSDVVQTIRYFNELDTLQSAGGATAPSNRAESVADADTSDVAASDDEAARASAAGPAVAPEVRVQSVSGAAGSQVTVPILVDAVGNESQYGFALTVNPSVLTFSSFTAGDTGANTFSCNATATAGRVRCSIGGFPRNRAGTGTTIGEIDAGNNQVLIRVIFTIAAGTAANTVTPVTLSDVSASDENATGITPAATSGTVTVTAGPTAAGVSVGGRVVTSLNRGIRNARVTLTDSQGNTRFAMTTSFGYYNFADVAAGETYIISVAARRYRFTQPTQVLSVTENLTSVDFIAEN